MTNKKYFSVKNLPLNHPFPIILQERYTGIIEYKKKEENQKMIVIWTCNQDFSNEKGTAFEDVNKALRFLYKMYNLGYKIIGWKCDYSWEHEYLERRFRK